MTKSKRRFYLKIIFFFLIPALSSSFFHLWIIMHYLLLSTIFSHWSMSNSNVGNPTSFQIPNMVVIYQWGCSRPILMKILKGDSGNVQNSRVSLTSTCSLFIVHMIMVISLVIVHCSYDYVNFHCLNLYGVRSCKIFIWYDELEGYPPYVCHISSEPRIPITCNYSEFLKDLTSTMKDFGCRKNEEIKMKLDIERNKAKLFKTLLIVSWILFLSYLKICIWCL